MRSRTDRPVRLLLGFGLSCVLLGALGIVSGDRRADAYVFYDNGADDWVVGASEAVRWSPEVWGPDSTLEWRVEDAPEWTAFFGSSGALTNLASNALSEWSGIPNSDIEWRIAGLTEQGGGRDSISQVFLDRTGSLLSGRAYVWFTRATEQNVWDIAECDVGLSENGLKRVVDEDWFSNWFSRKLRSWFQTCLGLGESVRFPGSDRIRESELDSPDRRAREEHYRSSPFYSVLFQTYGHSRDRMVGAALLRPRSGWLSSVGSVAGSLSVDGERVAYAHVWALRQQEYTVGPPVGAFSNRSGEFLIEGLEPGYYLLWAHPAVTNPPAGSPPLFPGATRDVRDAVLLTAVRVSAGGTTSGIVIPMAPGRS